MLTRLSNSPQLPMLLCCLFACSSAAGNCPNPQQGNVKVDLQFDVPVRLVPDWPPSSREPEDAPRTCEWVVELVIDSPPAVQVALEMIPPADRGSGETSSDVTPAVNLQLTGGACNRTPVSEWYNNSGEHFLLIPLVKGSPSLTIALTLDTEEKLRASAGFQLGVGFSIQGRCSVGLVLSSGTCFARRRTSRMQQAAAFSSDWTIQSVMQSLADDNESNEPMRLAMSYCNKTNSLMAWQHHAAGKKCQCDTMPIGRHRLLAGTGDCVTVQRSAGQAGGLEFCPVSCTVSMVTLLSFQSEPDSNCRGPMDPCSVYYLSSRCCHSFIKQDPSVQQSSFNFSTKFLVVLLCVPIICCLLYVIKSRRHFAS